MLLLIVAVMGLAGARMVMITSQRTRSDSMALAMVCTFNLVHLPLAQYPSFSLVYHHVAYETSQGAKSLILLAYQLLTEHVQRFKKWASLKAYFIINLLEIVFWVGVAGLNAQSNFKKCQGTTCALSWVVVVMAGIIQYVFPLFKLDSPHYSFNSLGVYWTKRESQ